MLVRCLYASRPRMPKPANIVDEILVQSRRNNQRTGITGLLCFTNDIFLQVIEGGRDEVCELFNAIVRDERHEGVRLLVYEEIEERCFSGWTMGQVKVQSVNAALLLKYSKRAELNPFVMSGGATMALLKEMLASGAIVSRGGTQP